MGTISAVVSSFNKAFGHEMFDMVEYDGRMYYEFAVRPPWRFSDSAGDYISGNSVPRFLIPADCLYFSKNDNAVHDLFKDSTIGYEQLCAKLGEFGVIEMQYDADVIVRDPAHVLFSDDNEHTMPCRDAFAYLTASTECGLFGAISPNLRDSNFDNIFKSCRDCFADENPADRVVRDVELNQSPVELADRHRIARMERRDYSKLPMYSGFVDLSHTVVRKDLISSDVIDVKGIPCRRVSVPTPGAFRSDNLDAKHLYQDVYVPADCFWSMPRDFGAFDANSDANNNSNNNRFSKKSPIRSRYAVCSISDNMTIFADELGSRAFDTRQFSSMLTCLTSCQLFYNNLLFDSSRFDKVCDIVLTSRCGGAYLTQAELLNDAPIADFDIADDVSGSVTHRCFTPPSRERVREVYEKSSAFSHGAPYGSDEPWDLSDRSGLNRVFSGALSVLSKSQLNFTRFPSVENAPSSEEFDPAETPDDGRVVVSDDYVDTFADTPVDNVAPPPEQTVESDESDFEPLPEPAMNPEEMLKPVARPDIPVGQPVFSGGEDFSDSGIQPKPSVINQAEIPMPVVHPEQPVVDGRYDSFDGAVFGSSIDEPPPFSDDDIPPEAPVFTGRDMSDIDAALNALDMFNGFDGAYEY